MDAESFHPCILVPVYNHAHRIGWLFERLKSFGLTCIVVDDGSHEGCRNTLADFQRREAAWMLLVHHASNRGKGVAILTGLHLAASQGFTHAVQIDADAQHDPDDIPAFLDAARCTPRGLIVGRPIFDASAPLARRYGRSLTNVWVWMNTLSRQSRDALCGYRVYPVETVLALAKRVRLGARMEFDPEILVRLIWEGVPVVNVPTRVTYGPETVSHFRLFRDNLRISWMHARLFFGMLRRMPRLLAARHP